MSDVMMSDVMMSDLIAIGLLMSDYLVVKSLFFVWKVF